MSDSGIRAKRKVRQIPLQAATAAQWSPGRQLPRAWRHLKAAATGLPGSLPGRLSCGAEPRNAMR